MPAPTDSKTGKPVAEAARRARLAAELRANLMKRKAQARARASVSNEPADDGEATPRSE